MALYVRRAIAIRVVVAHPLAGREMSECNRRSADLCKSSTSILHRYICEAEHIISTDLLKISTSERLESVRRARKRRNHGTAKLVGSMSNGELTCRAAPNAPIAFTLLLFFAMFTAGSF